MLGHLSKATLAVRRCAIRDRPGDVPVAGRELAARAHGSPPGARSTGAPAEVFGSAAAPSGNTWSTSMSTVAPTRERCMPGYVNRRRHGVCRGIALAGLLAVLDGSAALGQSPPPNPEPAARRLFTRWSLELAVGADSSSAVWEPFASAGLYLDDSLAVVAEASGGRQVDGVVPATGPAPQAFLDSPRSWPSKPAACPRVSAFWSTAMVGVQYRRPTRHVTPFAQVLGGRASYAAIAGEPKAGGVEVSCYEMFGAGRAAAAGGGVDVHLRRRIRLRFHRRLPAPRRSGAGGSGGGADGGRR